MDSEERALLDDASRGSAEAVESLIRRHLPELRAFVRLRAGRLVRVKETESDIVQSACREVLVDLADHGFADEAEFKRWLYSAALRKIVDRGRYYRAERRDAGREASHDASAGADLADPYGTVTTPSRALAGREELGRIEAAFDELSEDQREVILLSRLVGLPHARIAQHMGRTEQATRNLLSRALARLAGLLDETSED